LENDKQREIAARLRDAYSRSPVPPLRDGLEPTDGAGAYVIQTINTEHWLGAGRRIVGRKVGLTAPAVQAQLGVDQPDYGVLFADMQIDDGGELHASRVLQPKVEGEVVLVLARDINNRNATLTDVLAAAAFALPAIEIVDSRIADWKITFADTVADNASSAFFVLGTEPKSLAGLDLRACGMVLDINGRAASHGAGVACLGNPLNSAAWLARVMSELGDGLKAGDILLTGALGPMVPVRPGDLVRATIGGLGSCGFSFRDDR